jgi:hypothetical protein
MVYSRATEAHWRGMCRPTIPPPVDPGGTAPSVVVEVHQLLIASEAPSTVGGMPEARDMDELRRGVERIDLEHTLGDYESDIAQIRDAMDLDRVEDAKAAIVAVLRALRAVSESGFPVGAETDLAELVGFTDDV